MYGAEEKEGQKQEERETQPAEVIYYIEASGEEGSEPEQEEKEHLSASGEVSGQLTEADASMEELLLQENSADFLYRRKNRCSMILAAMRTMKPC